MMVQDDDPMSPVRTSFREHSFPTGANQYFLLEDDGTLKAHSDYRAAKAGDEVAAVNLVWDLAADFLVEILDKLPREVIYVAPFAREATGDNAIPQVLAAACAEIAGGKVDNGIVQVTRVFHTGADPMERLSLRAQFEGEVIAGERYVLVDDVISMGGTLAELADYIQRSGGVVTAVVTLVNAGRIKALCAAPKVIKKLQERHQMKFLTSSASSPAPSQPTKPSILLVSERLTRSEIDLLRQEKKSIADYAQKVFAGRLKAKMRTK